MSKEFVAVAEPRLDKGVLASAKAGINASATMTGMSAVRKFMTPKVQEEGNF